MPAAGRGGAGNIEQAQAARSQVPDHEANKSSAVEDDLEKEATARPAHESQPYAFKGRGGAGNYYEPATLAKTGTFSTSDENANAVTGTNGANADTAPISPTGAAAAAAASTTAKGIPSAGRMQGRGGAGNFASQQGSAIAAGSSAAAAAASMEQEMSAKILKDVEEALVKPGQAYLRPSDPI